MPATEQPAVQSTGLAAVRHRGFAARSDGTGNGGIRAGARKQQRSSDNKLFHNNISEETRSCELVLRLLGHSK